MSFQEDISGKKLFHTQFSYLDLNLLIFGSVENLSESVLRAKKG